MARFPCNFEKDLLKELSLICGPFYVKSFEKMYKDVNERELASVTVITGGNWNVKGKLLPGNSLLLNPMEKPTNWPKGIEVEISNKSQIYQQKHPKKKLFWSPILSSIEFKYNLSNGSSVLVKGNMLHLSVLQEIADNFKIDSESLNKKFTTYTSIILNSLYKSGLITNEGLNEGYSSDEPCIDLYSMTLDELMFAGGSSKTISLQSNNLRSNASTPLTYFSQSNNHNHPQNLSSIDKSILLQCSITRILKQLRSLSISDLFSRISMLPKLLTRFSPSLQDVMDALKQLHEKEFVQLAFGDGVDELIDLSENDLNNLDSYREKLVIKYLA